jgi:hypothetical protein
MARMKDEWEMADEERKYDAEKKNHQEASIKEYGKILGTAYHKYIYGDNTRTFYTTIANILNIGSITEKALALNAMIAASEERTENMIKRAVRNINSTF